MTAQATDMGAHRGSGSLAAQLRALMSARRLRRLLGFSSLQLLVQAAGFVAGIVIVRTLSPQDYGLYTLVVSGVALGNVMLDLGLANATLAIGGPLASSAPAMAGLLDDAGRLQRRLMIWLALPLCALFAIMLQGPQAPAPLTLAALAALGVGISALNAGNSLRGSVLRLRGQVAAQQRLEVAVNAVRALAVGMLALAWSGLDALVATAVLLAGAVLMRLALRPLMRDLPAPGQALAAEREGGHGAALRTLVRQQAPNSLYYCISSQLPLWLLAALGGTARVAEAGALSRLALLLSMVLAAVSALVQPYVARATQATALAAGMAAVNGFFVLLCGGLLGLALMLPEPMLWILGGHYHGLQRELPWLVAASVLAAWSGALYSIGAARGWLVPARWVIGTGVASTALGVAVFDVATVRGSLMLNTLTAGVAVVLMMVFVGRALRRYARGLEESPQGGANR